MQSASLAQAEIATGQGSLFGDLMSSPAEGAGPAPLQPVLPNIPPLSESERLTQEKAILDQAGEPAPIQPITSAAFNAPARRPPFSVLRNAVLEATIGDMMRPWEEALAAFAAAGGLGRK